MYCVRSCTLLVFNCFCCGSSCTLLCSNLHNLLCLFFHLNFSKNRLVERGKQCLAQKKKCCVLLNATNYLISGLCWNAHLYVVACVCVSTRIKLRVYLKCIASNIKRHFTCHWELIALKEVLNLHEKRRKVLFEII